MNKLKKLFYIITLKANIPDTIVNYINDIKSILCITTKIKVVALLGECSDGVFIQKKFNPTALTYDVDFYAGYHVDQSPFVFISKMILFYDKEFRKNLINATDAEILFTILHELRHVWQEHYEPSTYCHHNAIKNECIDDIAEVDADGFALAYFLSDKTNYSYIDIPTLSKDLYLKMSKDNGKRLKRAYELAGAYNFTDSQLDTFLEDIKIWQV